VAGGEGGGETRRKIKTRRKIVNTEFEQDNEDEGVLANFCRLHIILRILSWTSLVVAQRVFPYVAVYKY
jgi:hypothetical protein